MGSYATQKPAVIKPRMRETLHFQEQRHPSIELETALNFHSPCTWKQLVLKAVPVYTVLLQFKHGLHVFLLDAYTETWF